MNLNDLRNSYKNEIDRNTELKKLRQDFQILLTWQRQRMPELSENSSSSESKNFSNKESHKCTENMQSLIILAQNSEFNSYNSIEKLNLNSTGLSISENDYVPQNEFQELFDS